MNQEKSTPSFVGTYATSKNMHILFLSIVALVFLIQIYLYSTASFGKWIGVLGTALQIIIPCYVLVPVLWKQDTTGLWQFIRMLVIVLSITYILKFTVPETRPSGGSMSFPSGHTAGAFIGAVFLAIRYGLRYFLISTPLALFVGFSRLYVNAHWPIDVITAILLCTVVGMCFVKKHS